MKEPRILVVDDEEDICRILKTILEDENYSVQTARRLEKARTMIQKESPDLILLDIKMPDGDGLTFLESLRGKPRVPVIIISGHGQIEDAVRAIKLGAYDFLEKPIALERVLGSVRKALKGRERLRSKRGQTDGGGFIGESKAIQELKHQAELVARADVTVLILGESGTGKGLLAKEIYRLSDRASGPFVELNCAAIPDDLLEAELLGYERGAFTGAHVSRKGKFEQADEGVLFLDEIADLSLAAQAKVLKVIDEKTLSRLGSPDLLHVDVRLVAATNKDLREGVSQGRFREDLYFRLNVVPLWIPPLRARLEDIEPLFWHLLERAIQDAGRSVQRVDPAIFEVFRDYSWPGNIRELKNVTERLVVFAKDGSIGMDLLRLACPDLFERPAQEFFLKNDKKQSDMAPEKLEQARKRFESRLILERLELFQGNITRTAKSLGVSREYLSRKLKTLSSPSDEA